MTKRRIKKSIKLPLIVIGILISLILLILSSVGLNSLINKEDKQEHVQIVAENINAEKLADMSSYNSYDNDVEYIFQKSSVDEMISGLEEKSTYVTFFAYPDCAWSNEAMPLLNEEAKANDSIVNYIDINDMTSKELNVLKDRIGEYMNTNSEGKPTLYTPFTVFVKEGELILAHVGTVESHNAYERQMTETETMNFKSLLDKAFKKLR